MKDALANDILIGGPERREIVICDYDSMWPVKYEVHAKRVADALGDVALRVEHIGSTSVPGLAAKPIIDILLIVSDSGDEASYLGKLEATGYVLRVREPAFHEHRMFRTPQKDVHLHVFSAGSTEIDRYLIFRNRLRSNDHDRKAYEQTKRKLAAQTWPDMNAYADAKTGIIERILASAQAALQ